MRYEDWPDRLAAYLEARTFTPFAWGTNDCAVFANNAIAAILKDAPTADLTMRYRSQKGAYKWLLDRDATDLWDFVDKYYVRIPAPMARRGDVVAHMTTDKSVGVCVGQYFATPSDEGIILGSMQTEAIHAWRID